MTGDTPPENKTADQQQQSQTGNGMVRKLLEELVINRLKNAEQVFLLGYYAEAASHLRGAAEILDALAEKIQMKRPLPGGQRTFDA